jgi:hypothetical protein
MIHGGRRTLQNCSIPCLQMQNRAHRFQVSAAVRFPVLVVVRHHHYLSDHPKPATDYHLKTGQRE